MNHVGGFLPSPELRIRVRRGEFATNSDEYFRFVRNHILTNSTFRIISIQSVYGYVLEATLKDGVSSLCYKPNYTKSGCNILESIYDIRCNDEIRVFILKIVFTGIKDTPYIANGINKALEDIRGFTNECTIQFEMSQRYFLYESIIPDVISRTPKIVPLAQCRPFVEYVLANAVNPGAAAELQNLVDAQIAAEALPSFNGIGIIFMEHATGYVTLHNILNNPFISTAQKAHAYSLGLFGYTAVNSMYNYVHGDSHQNNVMINLTAAAQFVNAGVILPGCVKIIDFGRTTRISDWATDRQYENVKSSMLNRLKFIQGVSQCMGDVTLNNLFRDDTFVPREYASVYPSYQWLTPVDMSEAQLNDILVQLRQRWLDGYSLFVSNMARIMPGFASGFSVSDTNRLIFSLQQAEGMNLNEAPPNVMSLNGGRRQKTLRKKYRKNRSKKTRRS